MIAALGGLVALLRPRSVTSSAISAFGLLLAAVPAFATRQNAIPWGELHCVID
jgi:hypothetical protein